MAILDAGAVPHATSATGLGISRYTFGDLHDPDRLASLYERFCEEVETVDPQLWGTWTAYRSTADAPGPPIAVSNLLIAMATHVSRFVARLFQAQPSADALTTCGTRSGRPVPLQNGLHPPTPAAAT